jgi:hypothetical protein
MVVRLDHPELASEGDVALKLFDRRFATQLRENELICPWTVPVENEFHRFLGDDGASKFLAALDADDEMMSQDWQTWDTAQNEAYISHQAKRLCDIEVKVYKSLKDIQGVVVPRLITCVTISGSVSAQSTMISQYTHVPGIVLQYVKGFHWPILEKNAPRET